MPDSPFAPREPVSSRHVLDETPERAMVVCAHPDDAEIGPGGAVAAWTRRGCRITYVVCTNGAAGSNDPGVRSTAVVPVRRREQLEAAKVLGVDTVEFLDHPDGGLEDDRLFRGEIVRMIRKYRPHTVFCHDPHRIKGFQHRDHRMVGTVVLDAVYPFARDHLHFPEQIEREGLRPHKVRQVLMWGADEPDTVIDIGDAVEEQIRALRKHKSQVGGLDGGSRIAARLRARAREAASGCAFEYGAAFRRLLARV